jgi:transposase-like protein
VSTPQPPEASFYELTERYPDERAAERYFKERRWPDGVRCPRCGGHEVTEGKQARRHRQLWYCTNPDCKKMFSVTSGTVMDSSKLPLRKWLFAYHLMGASKKGMSALQLSRMLKLTYKTAWHLAHRVRESMKRSPRVFSGTVETDELYVGGRRKNVGHGYRGNKIAVQTILRRNSRRGKHDSQAQTVALSNGEKVDGRTLGAKLRTHTDPEQTILMTDEATPYARVGRAFKDHRVVNHRAQEYVRVDPDGTVVTTNSAEGYFANLRRQLTGTHHHTSKKHLPRYLAEHDFKFNTRTASDVARTETAMEGMEGKSLRLYRPASGRGASLYKQRRGEPRPDYVAPDGEPVSAWAEPAEPRKRRTRRTLRASPPSAAPVAPAAPTTAATRARKLTPPTGCTDDPATCPCSECATARASRDMVFPGEPTAEDNQEDALDVPAARVTLSERKGERGLATVAIVAHAAIFAVGVGVGAKLDAIEARPFGPVPVSGVALGATVAGGALAYGLGRRDVARGVAALAAGVGTAMLARKAAPRLLARSTVLSAGESEPRPLWKRVARWILR